jgi:hypothetical protein
MASDLKQPTAKQNAAYRRCLQWDRWSSDERGAGRSGLLSVEQAADRAAASEIVDAALADGVGFDRPAFGDVEAA